MWFFKWAESCPFWPWTFRLNCYRMCCKVQSWFLRHQLFLESEPKVAEATAHSRRLATCSPPRRSFTSKGMPVNCCLGPNGISVCPKDQTAPVWPAKKRCILFLKQKRFKTIGETKQLIMTDGISMYFMDVSWMFNQNFMDLSGLDPRGLVSLAPTTPPWLAPGSRGNVRSQTFIQKTNHIYWHILDHIRKYYIYIMYYYVYCNINVIFMYIMYNNVLYKYYLHMNSHLFVRIKTRYWYALGTSFHTLDVHRVWSN